MTPYGRVRALRLAVGLLLLCTACSSQGSAGPPSGPQDSPAVPATPTGAPTPTPMAADWTGTFELSLPAGRLVRDCDGDRMNLCLHDGERLLGDVELLGGYPLHHDERAQAPDAVLAARAEGFVEAFREDRATGCPDFTFAADEVVEAQVGGQPGSRAGFTLTDADGRVVERVVTYYTIHSGALWVVNADAYAVEGGCLAPSDVDPSFAPDDLAELEPYLDALVAGTPLPAAAGG